jgi:acyl carrier protein
MTDSTPPNTSAPTTEPSADELSQLQEALKRCSPATITAACEFRRTRRPEHLTPVIVGVIERYVERELRPKLKTPDDNLRLVEDLGIDSLTMMEIVLLAEDALRISVSNEELCHLKTLGDVRQFIATKVGATA